MERFSMGNLVARVQIWGGPEVGAAHLMVAYVSELVAFAFFVYLCLHFTSRTDFCNI